METATQATRMKALRTQYETEVVEVDGLELDSVKIEDLSSYWTRREPKVRVSGYTVVDGKSTFDSVYASATLDDMPRGLRDSILAWANEHLRREAEAKVAKHLAKVAS